MPRYFYRLTVGTEPDLVDFIADAARGKELRVPHTPLRLQMHEGLSVFDSLDAAFRRLRQMAQPHHGIAVLDLEETGFAVEQTGRDTAHHTLWASAEAVYERVQWYMTVVRVETRTS
jgi:hypothetical protein